MPFGTFILISLFYAVIGVRVVRDLWMHRREAFDRQFTSADRHLVDQAAFFLLVPISDFSRWSTCCASVQPLASPRRVQASAGTGSTVESSALRTLSHCCHTSWRVWCIERC